MAKVGKKLQILYSPCHISLTCQAHTNAHAAAFLPLFPQSVKHKLLTLC
nr:MAG TPA: SCA7, zinc-binding domain [Caudoviricetes sp.]